jgi:O-antigen ligase
MQKLFLVVLWLWSLVVASIGGRSMWVSDQWCASYGLDWDFSYSSDDIPLWVKLAWPVLILLTPLTASRGFVGLLLFCFADLSIQGSEIAARCAHRNGFLDWFLLSLVTALIVGRITRCTGSNATETVGLIDRNILWHPTFVFLVLFVCWVYFSTWLHLDGKFPETSLYYRRPVLWLHCLFVFYQSATELNSSAKRIVFIGFLVFTLIWRASVATHGVWLEGHFASLLVLVLPWVIFAMLQSMPYRLGYLWIGYLLLALIWVFGPNLDAKRSFLAVDLTSRIGQSAIYIPIVFFAVLIARPSKTFNRLYFFVASVLAIAGIVLVSNRASALSGITCLFLSAILLPFHFTIRLFAITLALIAVCFGILYEPLASRFSDMVTTGSGKERLELWRVAVELSSENLWLGIGSAQFPIYVPLRSSQVKSQLDVHNTLLEVLCENGIPGLALFGLFWLSLAAVALMRFLQIRHSIRCGTSQPRIAQDLLFRTWVHRATWVFIAGYFMVGLFGSRHNLPLAYMLAGLAFSVCIHRSSSIEHERLGDRSKEFA